MKLRKIVAISSIAAALVAVPVLASNVDFSFIKDYSNDDLVALRQAVDEEILSRDIPTYAELQPSHYIIGEEIPAGKYTLAYVENPEGRNFINYYVFNDPESYQGNVFQADLRDSVDTVNAPDTVTLEEGQLFIFLEGTIRIEKFSVQWN